MPLFSRRRKIPLQTHEITSPLGPVRILHDRWPSVILHVDGPGMPPVRLVPDTDATSMLVGDIRAPLRHPSRWALRRRSRTHTATVGNRRYDLKPVGVLRSHLLRDHAVVAEVHGTAVARYSPLSSLPGLKAKIRWRPGCDPTDITVGHALIVSFGAGAPGVLLYPLWVGLQILSDW
jgi:hypothetical protein